MSLDIALDPRTLEAAVQRRRARVRGPDRALPRASCTRTATGCSARCTTPRTRSRTRCCAAGAGSRGFEGRSSLRSWLYRIATNSCLRLIERRPKRVLPVDYGPPAEAHGAPASRWRVGLARAAARRRWRGSRTGAPGRRRATSSARASSSRSSRRSSTCRARQRAVLILRDVLGFAPAEIADALDTSAAAVSSALQRAHKTVDELLPERSQQATLRALGDERLRGIVATYVEAWERNDVDAILAHAHRGRRVRDAAAADLVPRPGGGRGVPPPRAVRARPALAARRDERRRPAGLRHLSVGRTSAGRRTRSTSSRSAPTG